MRGEGSTQDDGGSGKHTEREPEGRTFQAPAGLGQLDFGWREVPFWQRTRPRIAMLIGLIAVVTAAGILVGRALTPANRTTITTSSTLPVTTTPASVKKVRPPTAVPVIHWGPLSARVIGRFVSGAPGGTVAASAGRLVILGGAREATVFVGKPGERIIPVATLAGPRAQAAAFAVGGSVYLLGGERGSQPTDTIERVDVLSGRVHASGVFEEPIAESGLAQGARGSYLVGGWTGQKYATAILKLTPHGAPTLVARLPAGVRLPAVTLVGHLLYVAGGRTQAGLSRRIFVINTLTGTVSTLGQLPEPVEQALLVASGARLYLLGGETTGGRAVPLIFVIDRSSGAARIDGRLTRPLLGARSAVLGGRTLVVVPNLGLVYRLG